MPIQIRTTTAITVALLLLLAGASAGVGATLLTAPHATACPTTESPTP